MFGNLGYFWYIRLKFKSMKHKKGDVIQITKGKDKNKRYQCITVDKEYAVFALCRGKAVYFRSMFVCSPKKDVMEGLINYKFLYNRNS